MRKNQIKKTEDRGAEILFVKSSSTDILICLPDSYSFQLFYSTTMTHTKPRQETESTLNLWPLIVAILIFLIFTGCSSRQNLSESMEDEVLILFDGETLDGWEGDPTYWKVEDGNLVGEVTSSTLLDKNSFIIWQGDIPSDFELTVEYRVSPEGNSGINYRSELVEGVENALRGYQADLDGANRYTGSNYEERRRTTLASQGERTVLPDIEDAENLEELVTRNRWSAAVVEESLGDPDSLDTHIKDGDWNEYRIVAQGNHLQHYVNGVLMSDVTDNDTINQRFDGQLGVQVHVGPPMKIEYRNFRVRGLSVEEERLK